MVSPGHASVTDGARKDRNQAPCAHLGREEGFGNDSVTFFYTIRIFIDLQWLLLTEVVVKIVQSECCAVKGQPET